MDSESAYIVPIDWSQVVDDSAEPRGPGCGTQTIYQQSTLSVPSTTPPCTTPLDPGTPGAFLHDDCALAGTARVVCSVAMFIGQTTNAPYTATLTIFSDCPTIGNQVPIPPGACGGANGNPNAVLLAGPIAVNIVPSTPSQEVTFAVPNVLVPNKIWVGVSFNRTSVGPMFAANPQEIGTSDFTYSRCGNPAVGNNGCGRQNCDGTFVITIRASESTAPGSCCNLATGMCTVVPNNQCTSQNQVFTLGGACPNPNCQAATGACCVSGQCSVLTTLGCSQSGGTYLGNGTGCTNNCCPQSAVTAGDTCALAVAVPVPVPGYVTMSSDNTLATGPSDCAGLLANDRGWWQAFQIMGSQNADVTIDFCCSVPAKNLVYTGITNACPCGGFIPADDTLIFYGGTLPVCQSGDNNFRALYRGLAPGTYYYPVLTDPTMPTSIIAPYQFHVTAVPSMPGACCNDTACQSVDISECNSMGGVFLGVGIDCGTNPCGTATGRCCHDGACSITTGDNCANVVGGFFTALGDCTANCCVTDQSHANNECANAFVETVVAGGPTVDVASDNTGLLPVSDCPTELGTISWWHGFNLNAAASVTISFQCTQPVRSPVSTVLFGPNTCGAAGFCTTTVNVTDFTSDFGGTLPPLADGNFYGVWNNLPAGTYYYDILPDSTGPYFIHISAAVACACRGDLNAAPPDGMLNGKDIKKFVDCVVAAAGGAPPAGCACADVALPLDNVLNTGDVTAFVNRLLNGDTCP